MSRFSVLIPDAEAQIAARVARCLKASGLVTPHGLSRNRSASLRHSSLFTTFECSSEGIEMASWLGRIDEIVAKQQIDVVLPISDFGIRALSEQGRRLVCTDKLAQLPDPHIFDLATNKATLANFLTDHGIPQPPTVLVTVGAQISEDISALTFPVLAKPSGLSGGRGIRRCESRRDLDVFLAAKPEGEIWVVQELVEGHDVCVNMLCKDGKVIASTVQHAIDQSPNSYKPPTDFVFRSDSSVSDMAEKLIEKLSWSGIANIDMRYDAKRKMTVVLEVNGRYWASLLGSLNAGVNFPLLACEAVSGLIIANRRPHNARYFRGRNNMLRSLTGGGKRRIRPGETDLRFFVEEPLRLAWYLTTKATESVRGRLSSQYAPRAG